MTTLLLIKNNLKNGQLRLKRSKNNLRNLVKLTKLKTMYHELKCEYCKKTFMLIATNDTLLSIYKKKIHKFLKKSLIFSIAH
jgi:hypothetical protein